MAEAKDRWDKFDIGSKFAVSIAIATIAGAYTYTQNSLEKQRQLKSLEVETLAKVMPYLMGKDETAKKTALLAIRRIASTDFMTEVAQIYPSQGSVAALQAVVDSPTATKDDRRLAAAAMSATRITGKSYSFGTPGSAADDQEIAPGQALSLVQPEDITKSDFSGYFLAQQPPGTTGLMRRLDPTKFYLACRYDSGVADYLRSHLVTVTNPHDRSKSAQGRVVEWGPPRRPEYEGYVAALSPGLAETLGLKRGDEVEISFEAGPATTDKELISRFFSAVRQDRSSAFDEIARRRNDDDRFLAQLLTDAKAHLSKQEPDVVVNSLSILDRFSDGALVRARPSVGAHVKLLENLVKSDPGEWKQTARALESLKARLLKLPTQ